MLRLDTEDFTGVLELDAEVAEVLVVAGVLELDTEVFVDT